MSTRPMAMVDQDSKIQWMQYASQCMWPKRESGDKGLSDLHPLSRTQQIASVATLVRSMLTYVFNVLT